MNKQLFFTLYLPAVEKAVNNSSINTGFHVSLPEDFIDEKYINEVEDFANDNYELYKDFFDVLAAYFDAKNHYQTIIGNKTVIEFERKIYEYLKIPPANW